MSNPITTPLDTRQSLARMLPDVIIVHSNGKFTQLLWKESGEYVRDTELRHLVDMAEARLTREQVTIYVTELRGFPAPVNWDGCMGLHQTVEVCVLALTRVRATEEKK